MAAYRCPICQRYRAGSPRQPSAEMKTKPATRHSAGTESLAGPQRLGEKAANTLWAAAVTIRNRLKRAGLLGPLDGLSAFLGPRLVRPPAHERQVSIPL